MWWAPLLLVLPAVSAADPAPWWASAVYYRVLVDSFKDGDGDGLGDLMGNLIGFLNGTTWSRRIVCSSFFLLLKSYMSKNKLANNL